MAMVENNGGGSAWRSGAEHGYSLMEIMIVVCLVGIVSAMAVPVSSDFLQQRKADSGIVSAMAAITAARDRAVAERRNIQLTFVAPSTIRLSRVEVPSGVLTTVQNFQLDNGQVFQQFAGVPDTPDAFGAAAVQSFSGTLPVMFTSDGSLIDSNGDVVNGTIFLALPNQIATARAITIFGTTGLAKAWKWRGTKWML
jgi:type IV pilus assembly protein PilA